MEDILNIFRALADPTRLRIVLLVLKMELAVGELAQILEQSQPRISRHVRILVEAGLVERRKEGSWVFLRPGPDGDLDMLRRILRSEKVTNSIRITNDEASLSTVRKGRAEMAERYFADHAEEWDAIRSLYIPEVEVERAMAALLKDIHLGHMLDIGTGTGRMVELFGPKADYITALDKSPEMLRLARAKLLGDGSEKVVDSERAALAKKTDLKLGDFNHIPVENGKADSIILHQVLHYAQHPEAVLAEMARLLCPNGVLVIADFAPHDREELRTAHAHARLGFSDDSMNRWFKSAGMDLTQTRTLEGGELCVKIWVGRKITTPRLHTQTENTDKIAINSDILDKKESEFMNISQNNGNKPPALHQMEEAKRALDTPLFAGLAGDAEVSFEFFPPKSDKMEKTLWDSVVTLEPLAPRFVSVTYGAGGSTRERTHATVARIVKETNIPAAAHLTCVEASKEEIAEVATAYWEAGVRHIVALRGDPPSEGEAFVPHPQGYASAADLVRGLKNIADFDISVAAYPETHPEASCPQTDLDNLKRKLDAGASRAITQFFFTAEAFFRFRDAAAGAGIDAEIVPGILPVSNVAQTRKFAGMCGAEIPAWMNDLFEGLDDHPAARQLIAATVAAELCRKLYAGGVRQFHFYTLNRAELSYAICHLLGKRPVGTPREQAA